LSTIVGQQTKNHPQIIKDSDITATKDEGMPTYHQPLDAKWHIQNRFTLI